MAKDLTPCRRVLRPQYGEYAVHNYPESEQETWALKWKIVSLFCLMILILSSMGYTYAYFNSTTGNYGNTIQTASNSDFFEVVPGTALVWEPDSHKYKEKVAKYDDYGNVYLDFGIIHDEGIKQFKDVLRLSNRFNRPLELDISIEGPIGEVITDWTRKIIFQPSGDTGFQVYGSIYNQSNTVLTVYDTIETTSGQVYVKTASFSSGNVIDDTYNSASVMNVYSSEQTLALNSSGSSTDYQSLNFSLRSNKTGTYTGKIVITGLNGYIRMEIPARVITDIQMEKNKKGTVDQQVYKPIPGTASLEENLSGSGNTSQDQLLIKEEPVLQNTLITEGGMSGTQVTSEPVPATSDESTEATGTVNAQPAPDNPERNSGQAEATNSAPDSSGSNSTSDGGASG